jgi:hypothetical protein
MNHLPTQFWALLVIGVLLLVTFYACLWIAGRESEQERRFEARWDLEHEAADTSENLAENAYPTEAGFHARPSF